MSTLLLADDNASIRDYCRCELEDEGYRILVAHNGAQAVDLANQFAPELAVLDICMPKMDGLEALTRIRLRYPSMPVVLFTAFDDACVYDERATQATACVDKSADLTELKQVISSALQAKRDQSAYRRGLPPETLADSGALQEQPATR